MIHHTTSTSIIPSPPGRAKFLAPRAFPPAVIPSEARNLSDGLPGGFSAGGADLAGGGVSLSAAGFPTVKYLRILSRRLAPSPRIASKSSTLLNGPYVLRICKILPAVAGPIPGTCCNCSEVAVSRFAGRSGDFSLVPGKLGGQNRRPRPTKKKSNRQRERQGAIAGIQSIRQISKTITK